MTTQFKVQKVHFGSAGSLDFLEGIIQAEGASRILLVSDDDSFEKSGASVWIAPCLKGFDVSRFREFSPNPDLVDLRKGLGIYQRVNPDIIIAVGGGTAMDMAKLIGFFGALLRFFACGVEVPA